MTLLVIENIKSGEIAKQNNEKINLKILYMK